MTPPVLHDLEAEEAVIGAVLARPEIARAVLPLIDAGDFHHPLHAEIFQAVRALIGRGEGYDLLVVKAELRRAGREVDGAELMRLHNNSIGSSSYAEKHAGAVHDLSVERQVRHLGQELLAAEDSAEWSAIVAKLLRLTGDSRRIGRSHRRKSGARFVLDDPAELEPVWGAGDEIFWAVGEGCLIVGPSGTGKTTLSLQLVAALLGIIDTVLDRPVKASSGRVLYLAMDRPRQIRRAMRRIFGEEHREVLDELLVVWEGPIPADLGKDPEKLLELASSAGATTVFLDSLKDVAGKLTDDEVGGNVNRAIQLCLADGVDVLGLHHQRKGQGGEKPTTLEAVYGSTWLTAGAGSVVLLWGAPGDPIVELRHLKQPAAEVGPLKIEHDHLTGRSYVFRGQADPLVVLRHAPKGITSVELARIMFEVEKPSDNQRKKAQRQLDRLVRDGLARKLDGGGRGDDGRSTAARYCAVTDRIDPGRDHGQSTDTGDISPGQHHGHPNGARPSTDTPRTPRTNGPKAQVSTTDTASDAQVSGDHGHDGGSSIGPPSVRAVTVARGRLGAQLPDELEEPA